MEILSRRDRLMLRFLRTFFRLLYNPFAWTYDFVAASVSLGMWKSWVLSTLPYIEGPRVLELGHGPGHLQLALHHRGLWAAGLDRSPQMGRIAIRRLRKAGYAAGLVNGYAQNLPFPSRAFSTVVATFPTEYIADPLTLAEIRRVLSPGGRLIILPVAWITGQAIPHRLAAWLFRFTGQAPGWDESFADPFRKAGFDVRVERIQKRSASLLLILAAPIEQQTSPLRPERRPH